MISGENGNPKSELRPIATANSTLRIFQVSARTRGGGAKCTPWTRVTTAHAAAAVSPWRRTWRVICVTCGMAPKYQCPYCDKPSKFTQNIYAHIRKYHPGQALCFRRLYWVIVDDDGERSPHFFFLRFRSSHPLLIQKIALVWKGKQ